MKIAFVGGGYSACVSAINLKRKYPSWDICIFEYNNILLKKLKATGNGRCNINNISDDCNNYNDDKVKILLDKYPLDKQLKALKQLNIYTTELTNGCLYPISLSSENVCKILISFINSLNINVRYNCFIKDYYLGNNKIYLCDDDNIQYEYDKVIFSNGTSASFKLGCQKTLLDIFKNHHYNVSLFVPNLCPIKVKENVKSLFGVRFKCQVKVYYKDKLTFSDYGEIIFKKDGISGIVIFNATVKTFYNFSDKNYKVVLDILNTEINEKELLSMYKLNCDPLLSLIPQKLINYVYNLLKINPKNINLDDCKNIIFALHNLTFTFAGLYSLEEAQICRGGISIGNINLDNMESKIEKNVYFIGEILSIKGISGGFNLKFGLITSLNLIDNL